MQEEHQQEPYFLRAKLLEAVDAEYNVKDMPLILEVLGKLEVLQVSKEILEATRLGKTVNEFRRKVNDAILARRLKDLVKKWRGAVLVNDPQNPNPPACAPNRINGASTTDGGYPVGGNRGLLPAAVALSSGYTSASSSPTLLLSSSRVSPSGSYNSNSLSPRIGTVTNYAIANSTNVYSTPTNRNGGSSVSIRSPNHNHKNNPHLSPSSYGTLVSPSASTASPLLSSRVSPYKSKSPGGPALAAAAVVHTVNSNLSPLPSSHYQSSSTSYAPNAETVSRTNAANKRFRELDDSPLSGSAEPPQKKPRSAANGTLDDPMLALDDISRDSYASRGSDHSDGFPTKDHRFSVLAASPTAPGHLSSAISPQVLVPDLNDSSTATFDSERIIQAEELPKKKRRKKQNEYFQDSETTLREKLAQAQAEKAAKAAREREAQKNVERESLEQRLLLGESEDVRRLTLEETVPSDKLTGNIFVDGYLKSQNELRAKMVRDAKDVLSESDFQGAQEEQSVSPDKLSKKGKKHKKKHSILDTVNTNQYPTEEEILSQLPPIDPEILKEFENFQYDVAPSPIQPLDGVGLPNSYNKETESTNNLKSLSTLEKKPRKIDWGDSDDDLEDELKAREEEETSADIISQQIQVISESVENLESVTTVVVGYEEEVSVQTDDSVVAVSHRVIDEDELEKYASDVVPNLNGNYDKDGRFREWHETLTVDSYKGEPLHILPYTIIDF